MDQINYVGFAVSVIVAALVLGFTKKGDLHVSRWLTTIVYVLTSLPSAIFILVVRPDFHMAAVICLTLLASVLITQTFAYFALDDFWAMGIKEYFEKGRKNFFEHMAILGVMAIVSVIVAFLFPIFLPTYIFGIYIGVVRHFSGDTAYRQQITKKA